MNASAFKERVVKLLKIRKKFNFLELLLEVTKIIY